MRRPSYDQKHVVAAYIVVVGAPVSVGGEWKLQSDYAANCAAVPASLSSSQSGPGALVTLHDGRTIEGTIDGATLSAKSLRAAISGQPAERTMEGTMSFYGCGPIAFRAVRQSRKRDE